MYARIESVQKGAGGRLDLRVLGALLATLVVGVAAGFLAASLTTASPTQVVSKAPAAASVAPSTGIRDHDSRELYGSSPSTGIRDHDSRELYSGSSESDLQRGIDANVTALQGMAGIDWSSLNASGPAKVPFTGLRSQ